VKKELKIIASLCAVALFLGTAILVMQRLNSTTTTIYPFSKDFDVLSFFSKRELSEKPKYTIYGYLPYWTINQADNLQYNLLTDIAYFGLNLNADGTFRTKDDSGHADPGYNQWRNSDELNKVIKKAQSYGVRFALTIVSHDDDISDKFLSCPACWKTFEKSLDQELTYKGIDDVNLNFEYVEYTDESTQQKFVAFTKEINTYLHNRNKNAHLVVAAFADSTIKPRVTSKLSELGQNCDGIFIMAYDFHGPNSTNAGPVAPIGGMGGNVSYDIGTMLKDYQSQIPAKKLILGVPYYGYNWLVTTDAPDAVRVEGNDVIGHSESEVYAKVMDLVKQVKPDLKWDDKAQEPYFTYTSPDTKVLREVYFENEQSLKAKYDLVTQTNLQGVGIWALGYDEDRSELWNLLYDSFVKP
jgi:spore germination protein YaaH